MVYTAHMKRKKRKSKADIITGALYVIFGIMVLAVLYGLYSWSVATPAEQSGCR